MTEIPSYQIYYCDGVAATPVTYSLSIGKENLGHLEICHRLCHYCLLEILSATSVDGEFWIDGIRSHFRSAYCNLT
ncbi:hypothetical protein RIF29_41605 [Crotalaria pallida]|uniref:Uncharacterized protein n=1 Tax=Crotalaria pallida TaxID=3830 RepID=A0AAN9HPJ1_CROPI